MNTLSVLLNYVMQLLSFSSGKVRAEAMGLEFKAVMTLPENTQNKIITVTVITLVIHRVSKVLILKIIT